MKQYTFSIITPVCVQTEIREQELNRAIQSVWQQTYPKNLIEHIIVNDGSTRELNLPINKGENFEKKYIRVINQPNLQRITAYNTGLENAQNEIICFLDSDDIYVGMYLEKVNQAFNDNPDYKMINFGSIHTWPDGVKTERGPFEPKELEVGHEVFGGGNIVNGTFAFKKQVYDDLGGLMPPIVKDIDCTEIRYDHHGEMVRDLYATSPYDFSAWFQLQYPEIRPFFTVDMGEPEGKIIKELGNPFGQDFALFYKYTRSYKSKPIKEYLYHVYHHEGVH